MAISPIPEGHNVASPYLIVNDVRQQLEFLTNGLGAEIIDQIPLPDGSLMHGSARIGDSVIMVGKAQESFNALTTMVHIYCEDADAAWQKAIDAGATEVMPVMDQFYGNREGGVTGPCGNYWWFGTRFREVPQEEMEQKAAELRGFTS